MWIFAKTGFVSIVAHDKVSDLLLVRSRLRKDLVSFLKYCPDSKRLIKRIKKTPKADYPYRVNVRKRLVGTAVSILIWELNYHNFKEAVHDGTERDSVYMEVWQSCRDLDPRNRQQRFNFQKIPFSPFIPSDD